MGFPLGSVNVAYHIDVVALSCPCVPERIPLGHGSITLMLWNWFGSILLRIFCINIRKDAGLYLSVMGISLLAFGIRVMLALQKEKVSPTFKCFRRI